jgi:hypothetical protein
LQLAQPNKSWQIAAQKQLSIPNSIVFPVVSGYHNKVKDLPENIQVGWTSGMIKEVAKSYGSRTVTPENVIVECINIFLDKFSHLGLEEIKEAYRLWSIGQLNIKGSAEMYGGEFNAAQFGKIMAAYVEYRMTILGAYLNAREIEKREKEKAEVMERRKERNLETFRYDFDTADFKDYTEVPGWWFDVARKQGLIKIDKKPLWKYLKKPKG